MKILLDFTLFFQFTASFLSQNNKKYGNEEWRVALADFSKSLGQNP